MEVHFILVKPAVPENVGFVCRSLKNMGQAHLRIVASEAHKEQGARNTAYQAHDILEKVETFTTLDEAVADMDLVIGTTGKSRKLRYEVMLSENLPSFIEEKSGIASKIALVFGSESDGLSKEEENLCDVLSTIPMTTSYPSINLSHSVMIYAYELSKKMMHPNPHHSPEEDKGKVQQSVMEQSKGLLSGLEMATKQPGLYRRIMDKIALMSESDSRLVLSFLRYVRKAIKGQGNH